MPPVPPKVAAQGGLWRRTPPAIFPPALGLLALALGWRKAAVEFSLPDAAAEVLVGAISLLFVFVFVTYAAKFIRRPAVAIEDMRILPGRAGLAAGVLCLYLLAVALAPLWATAAKAVLVFGLALHGLLTLALLYVFATGPAEQRRVSPVWHLTFSGWVVAALGCATLGFDLVTVALFWGALVLAVGIWMSSLQQFARQTVPPPLRPLIAIHLAPAAVLGSVAHALGGEAITQVFAMMTALGLILLIARGPWLLAGGFSPLWGALTFPLAASANLWLTLGEIWRIPGAVALVVATGAIPLIATRIYKMWAKGDLALKTGAASL